MKVKQVHYKAQIVEETFEVESDFFTGELRFSYSNQNYPPILLCAEDNEGTQYQCSSGKKLPWNFPEELFVNVKVGTVYEKWLDIDKLLQASEGRVWRT
jgi:hypothetical protein